MAQVEARLAVAAPAQAPAAPLALPPAVESRPPPVRPSDESSNDSSDRRKKEKKEKKKKKREKRERRERVRSQGLGGGTGQPEGGGGFRKMGRGKWWWMRGTWMGRRGGVEVVHLPPCAPPPSPNGSSKPWAPSPLPPGRRGAIPW